MRIAGPDPLTIPMIILDFEMRREGGPGPIGGFHAVSMTLE